MVCQLLLSFVCNMYKTLLHLFFVSPQGFKITLVPYLTILSPVTQRIKYKIAILTFKTLRFGKPFYLSELLFPCQPLRNLHFSDYNLLDVPKILTSIGGRSFTFSATTA